ncbi:MAG: N-(5'-phosphoribosyl)anthranilate isomerase, partial [SAR324 cluster bacterium]|nr:N-(5'-phosphoribosyl)anthranilate isomerase [SAR324 cluster bacterium]
IERVRPFAVDVSGGVEAAPGRKDCGLLAAFAAAVAQADRSHRA